MIFEDDGLGDGSATFIEDAEGGNRAASRDDAAVGEW